MKMEQTHIHASVPGSRVLRVVLAMIACAAALFATVAPAWGKDGDDMTAAGSYYVYDLAGLLSDGDDMSRDLELEEKAGGISTKHNVGVYILTVDNYASAGYSDIDHAADDIYLNQLHLGMGSERDGIMLMLSMSGRDYSLYTYGKNAQHAFSDYATGELEKTFLDDFGDDDWQGGFTHYLDACDDYLTRAEEGHPVSPSKLKPMLIILAVSAGISLVVCLVIKSRNKSVATAATAASYAGQLSLTGRTDQFTHTTVERTLIESDSSGSSDSSVSHMSSGGSSRSGKF